MSTWWIDEPRLLGSSNPTLAELERLSGEGFSLLVSLLNEAEQPPNYDPAAAASLGFKRHTFPVSDFQPPSIDQLTGFVRLLERTAPARGVVHCLGGLGRTGTFAAAYWIARGMGAKEAILRVRKARPTAVETREQLIALTDFERSVGTA